MTIPSPVPLLRCLALVAAVALILVAWLAGMVGKVLGYPIAAVGTVILFLLDAGRMHALADLARAETEHRRAREAATVKAAVAIIKGVFA